MGLVEMREIKFKAFVKELNRIIPVECIEFENEKLDHIHLVSGMSLEPNEFELVQYTGLKDKNGVEIYEGDVLSLADCDPSLYKIVWWEHNFKYGIEYIGSNTTNWQEENLEEFSSELIKVVGNIYENPELLEQK